MDPIQSAAKTTTDDVKVKYMEGLTLQGIADQVMKQGQILGSVSMAMRAIMIKFGVTDAEVIEIIKDQFQNNPSRVSGGPAQAGTDPVDLGNG